MPSCWSRSKSAIRVIWDKAIQILLGVLRDIEGDTDAHSSDAAFTEADQQIIQRIRSRLRDEKE